MINLDRIQALSKRYSVPDTDMLCIALNLNGVKYDCKFNRIRMGLRITDTDVLADTKRMDVDEFYFALAVKQESPFTLIGNQLALEGNVLGTAINPSEDFCDSNYPRRKGTVLNMNPNSRTSCRGCKFCYTSYQIPRDRKRIQCEEEIREFFMEWMNEHELVDMSHLIQVAVVTGCYRENEDLCDFLVALRHVLNDHRFKGEIFYLGSQITDERILDELDSIKPFCYCLSLECFERRDELLRNKKKSLTLDRTRELMAYAKRLGFRVNFSYIVGLETLETVEKHFGSISEDINSFPIINTLQVHRYHDSDLLLASGADRLEYFLEARRIIEQVFLPTNMRPRVWENYRSLWTLSFGSEQLRGIRVP